MEAVITSLGGQAIFSGFGAGAGLSIGTSLSTIPTLSLLSAGLTGAGALSQIQTGRAESQIYKMQAEQSLMNARIEKVNAEEKANEIRRQLLANIGSADAIFASRGIGIGSGTPEQAKVEGTKNAMLNIEKARFGGTMASNERIMQAGQDRISGKSAKTSGYLRAASTLSNSGAIKSLLNI